MRHSSIGTSSIWAHFIQTSGLGLWCVISSALMILYPFSTFSGSWRKYCFIFIFSSTHEILRMPEFDPIAIAIFVFLQYSRRGIRVLSDSRPSAMRDCSIMRVSSMSDCLSSSILYFSLSFEQTWSKDLVKNFSSSKVDVGIGRPLFLINCSQVCR